MAVASRAIFRNESSFGKLDILFTQTVKQMLLSPYRNDCHA